MTPSKGDLIRISKQKAEGGTSFSLVCFYSVPPIKSESLTADSITMVPGREIDFEQIYFILDLAWSESKSGNADYVKILRNGFCLWVSSAIIEPCEN
jgi:hypothetical protein